MNDEDIFFVLVPRDNGQVQWRRPGTRKWVPVQLRSQQLRHEDPRAAAGNIERHDVVSGQRDDVLQRLSQAEDLLLSLFSGRRNAQWEILLFIIQDDPYLWCHAEAGRWLALNMARSFAHRKGSYCVLICVRSVNKNACCLVNDRLACTRLFCSITEGTGGRTELHQIRFIFSWRSRKKSFESHALVSARSGYSHEN